MGLFIYRVLLFQFRQKQFFGRSVELLKPPLSEGEKIASAPLPGTVEWVGRDRVLLGGGRR